MLVFLFTDIEGSTRLWEEHTGEMGAVIARHDAILQQQVAESGGRITKHTGDGVTAAFEGGEPVACALEAQKQFAAADWGALGELRIRIGLHAGEAEFQASAGTPEGDYFGPPVNATARVMSAAWGGQVLLTPEVIQASPLPPGATLRDLGEHLLKNVSAPQQLYQLDHPQLPWQEFPPPRTLSGQSIRQVVDERGSQLAGLDPTGMAVGLLTAILVPALQGELEPESGALEGNLGVLGDLGAGTLRAFTAQFAGRLRAAQRTGEAPGLPEIQTLLDQALLAEWQAGGETAAALRADASRLLQAVHGVEATMATATGEIKEALARGLADLGGQFGEFRWMLAGVQGTLAEMRARQALQLALQREQLDLQRQQLVKTNLLLHRRRGGPAMAELTVAGEVEEPPPADVPCPYKGLAAFEAQDAEFFFGREELVAQLTARLAGTRFLAVVGPSGSGKSSLVRAGLLPVVWDGALPGSEEWPTLVITPGAHPLNELAVRLSVLRDDRPASLLRDLEADHRTGELAIRRALSDQPGAVKLLLVVDQFEEIFALCRDEDERRQFINALLYAVEAEEGRTIVVPTVRADFYGRCADYPQLASRMGDGLLVGPMSEEELRAAMERPAVVVGLRLEPGLAEMILDDVAGEPGALPLLSHALLETFARRRGAELTLSGYAESGGVAGAIAQTADTVYGGLDPEQQALARSIFLRLTELGEEGAQDTRRRVAPAELVRGEGEAPAVEGLLRTLAGARLVTTGEDTVEVAHEALIREWPTLRRWLDEDREGLRAHRHLTDAAQEWERLDREPGELYRGARLATASEWAAGHAEELNPLEREFIKASRGAAEQAEREKEAARQRELAQARALAEEQERLAEAEGKRAEEQARATSVFRRLAVVLAGVLLVAVAAAVVAFNARTTAQREAAVNHSLVTAANAQQAQENGEVNLALALALEAVDLDQPPPEAVRTLSALALGPGMRAVLAGHSNRVLDVAFSPDSLTALSGSCGRLDAAGACVEGELIVWDVSAAGEAGAELRRLAGHAGWVNTVAFHPDGTTALSGSDDGALILWEVNTGENLRRLEGHAGAVNSVVFGPDRQTALSGSDDATLVLWDVTSGEPIHRFEGHAGGVNSIALSSDGQTALSGSADTTLILWDVANGEVLHRFEGHINQVEGVVFGLGGRTMLSAGDNTIRLWDLETGAMIRQQRFGGMPEMVVISPDGRTAGIDLQGLALWDIERWRQVQALLVDHQTTVEFESAAFSPDGRLALSGYSDGTLRLWNTTGQVEFRGFATDGTPLAAVAVSPDGRRLLTGDALDRAILWDVERGEAIRRFEGDAVNVNPNCIAFSPDGKRALVGSGDAFGGTETRSLVLWDIESGEEIRRFEGHEFVLRSVAIHPDGRTALAGSQRQTGVGNDMGELILWDLETGEPIRRFDTSEDITSIVFSADGNRALTGSAFFANATLWDVAIGQEILRCEGPTDMVLDVAFGPGETTALSASADRSLILWDVATGEVIRRYLGHEDMVWSVDVSPDGRYALSSSMDGVVILWDFETAEELRRFSGHTEIVPGLVFHPDGQTAFTVSADGALIEWQISDLPLEELIDWTYANRYVRELTCQERETYRIEPLCDQ
jgi:WD40 repeat protein/class 3 adenylate cyclase